MGVVSFFPKGLGSLQVIKARLSRQTLNTPKQFRQFLRTFSEEELPEVDEVVEVELLDIESSEKNRYQQFNQVLFSTNSYLCKNKGTAADFNVLKDICERRIESLDEEIHSMLNVPLYLGLGGTFLGVIWGVSGIDINQFFSEGQDISSVQQLLTGVSTALWASFIGLVLTVVNSAVCYNLAQQQVHKNKNRYYDFLQRELMPVLAVGMAGSLDSLKKVLGHFVDKFGQNLDNYADTAELLNDNLGKQQKVLEEINNLSLTRTATKIAQVFSTLKESSDELLIFRNYQKDLNETVQKTGTVLNGFQEVISTFKDFNTNLLTLSEHSQQTGELHKQFKESIETHFPTRSEYREVWRKEIDELNEDAKKSSEELAHHLEANTQYIRQFVEDNKSFFSGILQFQGATRQMVHYAELQKASYSQLKEEIDGLRQDMRETQKETLEVQRELAKAIRDLVNMKENRYEQK